MIIKVINRVKSWFKNDIGEQVAWDELPPRRHYQKAYKYPAFRKHIMDISLFEDEENPFYSGILSTIAEDCLGPIPFVVGTSQYNDLNDLVEDRWIEWSSNNGIGSAIRQIRRGAARTGLGIGIPYLQKNSRYAVPLGIKTICRNRLKSPMIPPDPRLRIYDGIEYDENWDIKRIYVEEDDHFRVDPVPYERKDIILWFKEQHEEQLVGGPECGPAFAIFPSVKRFIESVVKGEEFRASMPMAVKLDPNVWGKNDIPGQGVPTGAYEYEPNTIPTLPPGTELQGLDMGAHASERTQFIRLMVGAAARCKRMPQNIAFGDSSDHNMASAQVDIQPWKNTVEIDRFDFCPVLNDVFDRWYQIARRTDGYLNFEATKYKSMNNFPHQYNYAVLFHHPDPLKNASSRAVDLASGSTTLHRVYTQQGLNPRRELEKDAKLMGMSLQEYIQVVMVGRNKQAIQIIAGDQDEQETPSRERQRR